MAGKKLRLLSTCISLFSCHDFKINPATSWVTSHGINSVMAKKDLPTGAGHVWITATFSKLGILFDKEQLLY